MNPTLYVVERPGQGLAAGLQDPGQYVTEAYLSGTSFFETARIARPACILLDLQLPDMPGLELLERVRRQSDVPVVLIADSWEMPTVLRSLRLGILDLYARPVDCAALRSPVRRALALDVQLTEVRNRIEDARCKLARLTDRQRELMSLFAQGLSQKEIAAALDLSPRTVEKHRARLNQRLGTHRLSDYVHLNLLAAGQPYSPLQGPHNMSWAQIQLLLSTHPPGAQPPIYAPAAS
jgi:two-component system, LuxR family, response regulator FixJ